MLNLNEKETDEILETFFFSFGLIFISELCDKTFIFIILKSREVPSIPLFFISFFASIFNISISIFLGYLSIKYISKKFINICSSILFLLFGLIYLYSAYNIYNNCKNEATNNYKKIENNYYEYKSENEIELEDLNSNGKLNRSDILIKRREIKRKKNKPTCIILICVCFLLIISEIGDKSQITTITMTSKYNIWILLLSNILVYFLTNLIAIVCGKIINEYISKIKLLIFSGIIFIVTSLVIAYSLLIELFS